MSPVNLGMLLVVLSLCLLSQVPAPEAAETSLLDPQYYNIAPCPCNLQASACDIGCCCDSACSTADKLLFDCAQGFYGGNTTLELYRLCASTDRDNPDYHPFTCVLIENYNAYLGLYFPVQTAVGSLTDYEAKRITASSAVLLHQFLSDSSLGLRDATTPTEQRKGLVVLETPSGVIPYRLDNSQLANYRLALPRRILAGGCDRSSGVVYLEDATAACDLTITAALCRAGVASPLDAAIFATGCVTNGTGCQALVQTVQTFGGAQFVPVTVGYQNLTRAYGYQKGVTARSSTASGTRQSPSLSGTVCNNAVVEVQYRFVWSGSSLVSLTATVYLAPVQVGSVVTQRFGAAFTHLAATVSTASGIVKRSGLVGYEPGAALLGGRNSSGIINASTGYWPRLWRANSAGACDSTAAGDPVLFQMDATSYCAEQVLLDEFNDCATLRERLRAKLRAQFSLDVIGIFGSSNASVTADWVSVLEQGLASYSGQNFSNSANSTPLWTSLAGVCLGLPTEIVLTVLYAEQGKANDSSIWQVVGAYLRYKQVHVSGVCGPLGCNATSLAMSTGVQFVRVPPDWADNNQAYFGPYKVACWWGICWDEMFYPLTADFEGESRAMSIAWCIFLVLISVYAFFISNPWW